MVGDVCCGRVYILSSLFSGQASAREESVGGLSLNPSREHTHTRATAEPGRAGPGLRVLVIVSVSGFLFTTNFTSY